MVSCGPGTISPRRCRGICKQVKDARPLTTTCNVPTLVRPKLRRDSCCAFCSVCLDCLALAPCLGRHTVPISAAAPSRPGSTRPLPPRTWSPRATDEQGTTGAGLLKPLVCPADTAAAQSSSNSTYATHLRSHRVYAACTHGACFCFSTMTRSHLAKPNVAVAVSETRAASLEVARLSLHLSTMTILLIELLCLTCKSCPKTQEIHDLLCHLLHPHSRRRGELHRILSFLNSPAAAVSCPLERLEGERVSSSSFLGAATVDSGYCPDL